MSKDQNHRSALALLAGCAGLVALVATGGGLAWGQGSGCSALPPQAPSSQVPGTVSASAWVDPVNGEDTTGQVLVNPWISNASSAPYRTIQAAVNGLQAALSGSPQAAGLVNLLPGRYGSSFTTPGEFNGEVWPVVVPANISLRGVNALGVMLDGSAVAASSTAVLLPDPVNGGLMPRVPVLRYTNASGTAFEGTAVSHVTIHDAQVGILVDGAGEASPTVANTCITHCSVGVQVHAVGLPGQGLHRPRLWHCTVANNDYGLVVTGETGMAGQFDSRPHPTLVNSLFKNLTGDFEGVACQDIVTTAFDPTRVNASPFINQPAQGAASAAFDSGAWSFEDLFLGARYVDLSSGAGPNGPLFTDLRLTFRSAGQPTLVNPALTGGNAIWPVQADNGTLVDITFPFGPLGWRDAEGNGNPGTTNPNNPSGTSLGYDLGGVLHVGGSAPVRNRYGLSTTGVLFNAIDAVFRDGYTPVWVFANIGPIPSYLPGGLSAQGIVDIDLQNPVPGIQGTFALDPNLQLIDLSFLLAGLTPTNPTITLPIDMTTLAGEIVINLQAVGLTALGQWRVSEPQSAYLDPTGLGI